MKDEKGSFIEEAIYKGMHSPKTYDAKYSLVEDRLIVPTIRQPKFKPGEEYKIEKNDTPS